MTYDHAASVQGVALRVCKLDAAGEPLVGASSSFVTNAFMKAAWTPEYNTGDEIEEKAADGSTCIYYQMPDTLKRVELELAICNPDPELYEMLTGGTILTASSETVGYQGPPTGVDPTPNGVGIEIWSRAIVAGKPAATLPYFRWVFPYAKMKQDGDRTLENGALANVFKGYGLDNAAFGTGPAADWTFDSDRAYQFARVATVPTITNGYVAVV